jgi:ABC-type spermidine/putrescine transport system permease subunit I
MTALGSMAAARTALRGGRARVWSADRGVLAGVLLAAPMILLIAVMLIYPLGRLVSIAFGEPDGLGNIGDFFASKANTRVIRITFVDSAIVTVICVVVGSVLAWSLRTTTSRVTKSLLWAAMILPFLMGTVIKLYALTVLLESHGVINRALQHLGITNGPVDLLYNQFAVVFGMTYQMLPFAVLPLLAGFQTINPDLVQAAESLGASRMRALVSTVVPLSIPSLLASGTVVYIISVGFFLTPVLLGGATAPFTSSLIAQDVFEFYDVTSAAVSALILLIGSLLVVSVSYALVGRERLARAVAS